MELKAAPYGLVFKVGFAETRLKDVVSLLYGFIRSYEGKHRILGYREM